MREIKSYVRDATGRQLHDDAEAEAVAEWCRDWCRDTFEDQIADVDECTALYSVHVTNKHIGLAEVLADVRRLAAA